MTASTASQIPRTRSRPHAHRGLRAWTARRAVLLTGAIGPAGDAPTASTVRLSPSLVSGLDTATDDMCVLRDACAWRFSSAESAISPLAIQTVSHAASRSLVATVA